MDFIGLGLLTIGLAALELMLDKGQEHDWFDSPLIVWLCVIAVGALISTIFWELRHPAPIINLRLFRDRNFSAAAVCVFFAFAVLYGSNVLLPQMLQTLMGYSALNAGLVLSPAGFVTMLEMPLIGLLLSRGVDARKMIVAGLATVGVASLWMSGLNLGVSPGMVISPRNFQTLGAGLMFVPLNLAAYAFIPKEQVNNASGLFSLVRNEGSSIGVAITNTLLQRRTQFHQFRLIEHLHPDQSRGVELAHGPLRHPSGNHGGDPVIAHRQGLLMLYQDRPATGGGGLISRHVLAVRLAVVCRDSPGFPHEAVEIRRGKPGGSLNPIRSRQGPQETRRSFVRCTASFGMK